jgi:tripartite-type tricarboxylate transporter receptor subunit TctC
MKIRRREFLYLMAGAAGAAALPAVSRIAAAQTYPSRPARLIVGFAPGGSSDIFARLIGGWLSERLGQPFVIENRPGANSNIATEAVAHATPDGHTLLLVTASNAINLSVYDRLNFNFIRDIVPVAGIVRLPNVMVVHPSFPATSVSEFIAYGKANPNRINMASAGTGSPSHLAGELFKMITGVSMVHVPYRGGAPAIADLLAGQVQVQFDAVATSIAHIKAGKLRALAVTTAARSPALADIPALGEFVPGYESSGWYGLGAPRNTPASIVEKLNSEINAALADSGMKTRLTDLGGTTFPGSPYEFGKLIAEEAEKWTKVVKFSGVKA